MANQLRFIDGIKSIDLPQYPDEAWTWLSGGPSSSAESDALTKVAWPYRAISILSQAIKSIPFAIVKGEKDIDTSDAWQNELGFWPNPKQTIGKVCAALNAHGKAYLHIDRSRLGIKELRYWLPNSVKPVIDPIRGLTEFKRPVNNIETPFPIEDIIYFWFEDHNVEIGEPKSWPAKAALSSAGVMFNIDEFISMYFARGAIKATILSVAGNPQKDERDKLETWWKNMLSGIKNSFTAKVVNADAVKATIIGEGLESLKQTELTATMREDIATAFGIPQTILFSNAANYATAISDRRSFFEDTIIPLSEMIAETFNDQLFKKMGYQFEFRPDGMDIFQEDEAQRATAFAQYVSGGMLASIAAQILGIELPEGVEYEDLDPEAEPEKPPQEINPVDEQEQFEEAVASEMKSWEKFAINHLGKKSRPFECKVIPEDEQARINGLLKDCRTPENVKAIFEGRSDDNSAILAQLDEAVRLLREGE